MEFQARWLKIYHGEIAHALMKHNSLLYENQVGKTRGFSDFTKFYQTIRLNSSWFIFALQKK